MPQPVVGNQLGALVNTEAITLMRLQESVGHKMAACTFIGEEPLLTSAPGGRGMFARSRDIIYDKAGAPLCCIIMPAISFNAIHIYSFQPYLDAQEPSGKVHDGKPLYACAIVEKDIVFPEYFGTRMAASKAERDEYARSGRTMKGVYSEHVEFLANPSLPGYPTLEVYSVKSEGGDAVGVCLVDRVDKQHFTYIANTKNDSYLVSVAPGIDPVLMFALAVIHDRRVDAKDKGQARGNLVGKGASLGMMGLSLAISVATSI